MTTPPVVLFLTILFLAFFGTVLFGLFAPEIHNWLWVHKTELQAAKLSKLMNEKGMNLVVPKNDQPNFPATVRVRVAPILNPDLVDPEPPPPPKLKTRYDLIREV